MAVGAFVANQGCPGTLLLAEKSFLRISVGTKGKKRTRNRADWYIQSQCKNAETSCTTPEANILQRKQATTRYCIHIEGTAALASNILR